MALPTNTNVYGRLAPKESDNRSSLKVNKIIGLGYSKGSTVSKGYFHKVTGVELIKRNISQLLKTETGERFMLPNYGCGMRKYLMDQLDESLFTQVRDSIQLSVSKYLRNINLLKLQILETDTHVMNIKLFCSLKDESAVTFEVNIDI